MPHRKSAKLATWQVRLLVWSGVALWLTGTAWLVLHYFGQVEGEFGYEANPLEPWTLKAHGAAMIAALLGIGGLFVAHIGKGWTHRGQRVPGLVLSAFLVVLTVSGWLLYYAGSEALRVWNSLVHWTVGFAAPAAFMWHYINGKRQRPRSTRDRTAQGEAAPTDVAGATAPRARDRPD